VLRPETTAAREGSHIARTIVQAMLDSGVKVMFVTHFYDLAHGFYANAAYLRRVPLRARGGPGCGVAG
jgi:DNA mismatch repair ATPase MutS